MFPKLPIVFAVGILLGSFASFNSEADEVSFERGPIKATLVGEILVEAQDGGILFQANDGKIWLLQGDEVKSKEKSDSPVEPVSKKEMGKNLLKELPEDFRLYQTEHFIIAYQTNKTYARWVGGLYERLFRGFDKFWTRDKNFELKDPAFPMVAIIFDTKASYSQYVVRELGEDPNMVAYYNLQTNRVAMYDLTTGLRPANGSDNRKVNEILNTPNSVPMVATIIHEGTHQQIFNRGMQTRFADTPLWLNEGLAMYFETPDLKQAAGWKGIGKINPLRYPRFISSISRRDSNALAELVSSSDRFQNPETLLDAYAESWALNYFLINEYPEEYVAYIKQLSVKEELIEDSPEKRLAEFKQFFGEELELLDREFVQFMRKIR